MALRLFPVSSKIPEPQRGPVALPKELLASTLFLLVRAGMAMKARTLKEFERAGFSMYQYSVMALLAEGDSATQTLIASVLGVDRSQLVGVLDDLEERGLIERRRDPDDRRRHTVRLTADGKRRLVALRSIVERLEDSFLEPLDSDERAALHATLERVTAGDGCVPVAPPPLAVEPPPTAA
jgi:DNA-binding MarR family transcriptional regulator